jgi:DNA-binding Lrp family transcriptional regulator
VSSRYVVLDWSLVRNKSLTMNEKLVLSEIKQLTQLQRGCVASNQHFADLMGIKRQAASRIIVSLESKGFIQTEIVKGSRNMMRKIRCQQNVATCQQNVVEVATKCLQSKENKTINKTDRGKNRKTTRFKKPTADQINAYLKEGNNDNLIDADAFIDYYQAKDWMIGSNRMKDWKAAVRTWLRRESKPKQNKTDIKSEIFARISRGVQNGYDWKSPEAEAVFNKMRQSPGGVPWNGNEWQINNAISEVI